MNNPKTAEVHVFRKNHEYATFMLFEQPRVNDPHTGYFALAIESSFGGFSYAWGCLGVDFKRFLSRVECDYIMKKMCSGEQQVFDGDRTTKLIRELIVSKRRTGDGTAEEAREAWPESTLESEVEFADWDREQSFLSDGWELACYGHGRREHEFNALYQLFWPMLREALGAQAVEQQEATGAAP